MLTAVITCYDNMHVLYVLVHVCAFNKDIPYILWFYQMQTFYFSFCTFSILADSRNQLCFVGSHWIHLYRTSIYGYAYIHGYPRKICGCGYGYGWELSYPRQPWKVPLFRGSGEVGERASCQNISICDTQRETETQTHSYNAWVKKSD